MGEVSLKSKKKKYYGQFKIIFEVYKKLKRWVLILKFAQCDSPELFPQNKTPSLTTLMGHSIEVDVVIAPTCVLQWMNCYQRTETSSYLLADIPKRPSEVCRRCCSDGLYCEGQIFLQSITINPPSPKCHLTKYTNDCIV